MNESIEIDEYGIEIVIPEKHREGVSKILELLEKYSAVSLEEKDTEDGENEN